MLQNRIYSVRNKYRSILLSIVFLVCIIAVPFVNIQSGQSTYSISQVRTNGSVTIPIIRAPKSYLNIEDTGNEILNNIEISFLTYRNNRYFQNITSRILYDLIPVAGSGVLIYCFGYFNRKKARQKSIMSMSIGGHSPPLSAGMLR